MTYTNLEVHEILRSGFDRSPMFNGRIKSIGPRYCPSIEDKINRFATKDRHQLFIEPEGWDTVEVYVNGFSTSLPEDIQDKALRQVAGFENVKFFRYGYAIEYDYFPPTQLRLNLETKLISNLFFAGQINGTTGYEEAAAQGLMAGINAALKVQNKPAFILSRSDAYIGVLIDDLVTKGTEEPYRMFTSRAEYRTLLRQDNADIRLTKKSFDLGLANQERMDSVLNKEQQSNLLIEFLQNFSIKPEIINPILEANKTALINQSMKLFKIAARPQLDFNIISNLEAVSNFITTNNICSDAITQAEIYVKYSGYIEKEKNNVEKLSRLEHIKIPSTFNYTNISSITIEARQKLTKIRPQTIAQAARISGVSPSDISILLVYMGR